MIRFKPPLPAIKGLFGKPTVVNNVLSLATVPIILDKGAELYADFGMGRSRGTHAVPARRQHQAAAAWSRRPSASRCARLIYDFGGGTASGRPFRAVQVGGPLGAYFPESLLDTPLDYEAFAAAEGHARPRRHRRVRRHRRPGEAGALRHGVLRHRELRQVHALPHRLDARRRGHRQGSSPAWTATQNLELLRRPLRD